MIDVKEFFGCISENGISFFTGVPDSLLKDFCFYINDNVSKENHIIAANEGSSIALASGYYLSTGQPGLVYMQNSGLGNAVNPLLSLADSEVYSIPMLMLIGWRGEPGIKDEPQHKKQGRVLLKMLEAMEIPNALINNTTRNYCSIITEVCRSMREKNCPHAILISKSTFQKYETGSADENYFSLSRAEAVELILDNLNRNTLIISTTGMISREVFEYRKKKGLGHNHDFLTVGSMGHCSQIAMGIAMNHKERDVCVLDGDGAAIMHMGALAISGSSELKNYKHIVINNGAHESVGGQPTAALKISLTDIARACGYRVSKASESANELSETLKTFLGSDGPAFLEVRVKNRSNNEPARPDKSTIENKIAFMNLIRTRLE